MDNRKEIMRELLILSVPTVLEQIMSTLLQYVDTAMVGRLGEQATAAVSTTTTINWLASCVPGALGAAVLALAARENGAGHRDKTRQISGQFLGLSAAAGLILTALCLALSPCIPVWMGTAPEVRPQASTYFFIISIPLFFRVINTVYGAAIRAVKDTKTPMMINLAANILNVILNGLLIYGFRLGVTGAAIATAVSYTAAGILMLAAAWRRPELAWRKEDLRPDRQILKESGKIGFPALGTYTASCLGYVFFAGMVSGMGTTIFAAHSIAVTAETLFYIPGYGFRTASSALIGNAAGAGDLRRMEYTEKVSIFITVGAMVLSGLILYLTAYPLMCLFTISMPVAELGAEMLRLVAFTEPFFGLMIVLEGIFYGIGRTRGVFVVETTGMWGIRILFTFFVTKVWHLDLRAVWYCMIADNIFKAVLLLILYLRMRKKRKDAAERSCYE